MNSGYFFKLAVHNLRYHKRLYLPLMVAQSFMIAMFYNNTFLVSNQEFISVPGVAGMLEFYIFSLFYVGIFACLFTVYLNFFAAKQRKHELGIYTALGMEKRHIAKLIVHENLILSAITLAGGLLLGIILSKLLMVFLCNIIKTNTTIPFSISLLGVLGTLVLFILVFFFILIARIISTNFSA
ncbi:MAG: FtsX-like permease family protein, partial [Anaerovoracaceae bacterium]